MKNSKTKQKLFTPSLLDRLVDDKTSSKFETKTERFQTEKNYKDAVLRDLTWLLNSINSEHHINFDDFPHAKSSVVNYGLPSLLGKSFVSSSLTDLSESIKEKIILFEPRIVAETLSVKILTADTNSKNNHIFKLEIKSFLWFEPHPIDLYFESGIDIENNRINLLSK